MDSFEAGSRRPSPRQANRGASLDLVSRAVSADKAAYQYLGSLTGYTASYCIPGLCFYTKGYLGSRKQMPSDIEHTCIEHRKHSEDRKHGIIEIIAPAS